MLSQFIICWFQLSCSNLGSTTRYTAVLLASLIVIEELIIFVIFCLMKCMISSCENRVYVGWKCSFLWSQPPYVRGHPRTFIRVREIWEMYRKGRWPKGTTEANAGGAWMRNKSEKSKSFRPNLISSFLCVFLNDTKNNFCSLLSL